MTEPTPHLIDTSKPLRVLIAEDHQHIRQALTSFLAVLGFDVVGAAGDGRLAVELAHAHAPDLVIMDMSMPDLAGPDATRLVLRDHPRTVVVALSAYSEIAWVMDALEAGVSGYVLKDSAYDDLPEAIERALAGGYFVSRQIHGGTRALAEFLASKA